MELSTAPERLMVMGVGGNRARMSFASSISGHALVPEGFPLFS